MSESLLSFSEVLLFGRILDDLVVKTTEPTHDANLATVKKVTDFEDAGPEIDEIALAVGQTILVRANNQNKDGLYTVSVANNKFKLGAQALVPKGEFVIVASGDEYGDSIWKQVKTPPKQRFNERKGPLKRTGVNKQLQDQFGSNPKFARIYGFSYEGTYYELPEPTVFLVHGDGKDANATTVDPYARAPLDPSKSGVASAEYQVADGIKVWAYDKADYTMRMDVMSGMFEQVLLDLYFGFDSPAISGAKVSGAKVSGAKVSGAKVSGAKVSGAKVSGAKARGSGD